LETSLLESRQSVGRTQALAHNDCAVDPVSTPKKPAADAGSSGSGIVNKGGKFSDLDGAKQQNEVGHHMAQNAINKTSAALAEMVPLSA